MICSVFVCVWSVLDILFYSVVFLSLLWDHVVEA